VLHAVGGGEAGLETGWAHGFSRFGFRAAARTAVDRLGFAAAEDAGGTVP
jgi:hypothetical protein